MLNAFLVGIGGFFGAISRYLVSGIMTKWLGSHFPWGTLTVNLLGSLIMGFLFGLVQKHLLVSEQSKLVLMVGFLGSFTTFSSFALDNVKLFSASSYSAGIINISVQNITGILLVVLGVWLASLFG